MKLYYFSSIFRRVRLLQTIPIRHEKEFLVRISLLICIMTVINCHCTDHSHPPTIYTLSIEISTRLSLRCAFIIRTDAI